MCERLKNVLKNMTIQEPFQLQIGFCVNACKRAKIEKKNSDFAKNVCSFINLLRNFCS